MNFSTEPVTVTEDVKRMKGAQLLLSNYPVKWGDEQAWTTPVTLRGYEGRVYLRGECCNAEACGCTGIKSQIPDW